MDRLGWKKERNEDVEEISSNGRFLIALIFGAIH